MLVLFVGFGVLFPLFFHSLKLVTEVREDGLYVRFYPLHSSFRNFPFESIWNFEALTYSPIRDYGGWGIRCGPKGDAYNTSGNRGVLFELVEGNRTRRLMIGSQTPEKLALTVRQGMELKSSV